MNITTAKRLLLAAGIGFATTFGSTIAGAQGYPTKQITVIIPFAGGSASDVVSRIMFDKMSKNMGQPIIVENRPGAGGNSGTQAAARALEATFGREPVYVREGGSIPVCASFESILELPVVLLGFDQPDNHAHAPNEWMDLRNYETGIRAVARMWDEVAALDLDALRQWQGSDGAIGKG